MGRKKVETQWKLRPNGWSYSYEQDGKLKWKATGEKDIDAAKRKRDRDVGDQNHLKTIHGDKTISELIAYRRAHYLAPGGSGANNASKRGFLWELDMLDDRFGHLKPMQLSQRQILDWVMEGQLKPQTIGTYIGTLKGVFTVNVADGELLKEHVPHLVGPKKVDNDEVEVFNFGDVERIWDAIIKIGDQRGRINDAGKFAIIAMETGQRQSVIQDLTYAQLHSPDDGYINFTKDKKTSKSAGVVGMSDRLAPLLARFWDERLPGRDTYIMDSPKTQRIRRHFRHIIKVAGLGTDPGDWPNPHKFRHHYGAQKLHEGFADQDIADQMGHSLQTFRRHYRHLLNNERLRKVANPHRVKIHQIDGQTVYEDIENQSGTVYLKPWEKGTKS